MKKRRALREAATALVEMIVHKDGQWCVMSKDGTKNLGCFPTEEEAKKRLARVEFFKHTAESLKGIKISRKAMREICPACAEEMSARKITAIDFAALAESETFLEQGFSRGMCEKFGDAEGFRTRCMASSAADEVDDPGAFCNALKGFCFGKVSAESNATEARRSRLFEGAPRDIEGRVWDVVLIEAGESLNGTVYSVDALKKAVKAGLFNDLPAHLHEDGNGKADHFPEGKDSRKFGRTVIGKFTEAEFDERRNAVVARFHFVDDEIRKKNLEAFRVNGKPLFEFSINGEGEGFERGGKLDVELLTSMKSVDAVSNAAAGGRFLRAVASVQTGSANVAGGKAMDFLKLALALIRECAPKLLDGKDEAKLTASEVKPMLESIAGLDGMKPFAEAIGSIVKNLGGAAPVPAADTKALEAELKAAIESAKTARSEMAAETAKLAEGRHKDAVEKAIREAKIEGDLADQVRELAAVKPGDAKHLEGVVARTKKIVEAKGWNDPKLTGGSVEVVTEERDRMACAIGAAIKGDQYGLLESDGGKKKDRVGAIYSLREAFAILSGDHNPDPKALMACVLTGIREAGARFNAYTAPVTLRPNPAKLAEEVKVARAQLHEGLRSRRRIREAVDTTTFNTIFADTLYRSLIDDYELPQNNDYKALLTRVVVARDDRSQRFQRLGQYEQLPVLAEGAPYVTAVSPQDEEVAVTPVKRGYTEDITIEAVLRDDIRALAQIPLRMMRAAQQTRRREVLDMIVDNDLVFDGVALFAAGHGTNNGLAAFTIDALSDRRAIRRRQTAFNGAFHELGMGNDPKIIISGPELMDEIAEVVRSTTNPTATFPEGVFNPHAGIRQITLDFATVTATAWWTSADPKMVPVINQVVVRGWEEPRMAVNDNENVGPMFDEDRSVQKISDFFGQVVLDWRGLDRGNA